MFDTTIQENIEYDLAGTALKTVRLSTILSTIYTFMLQLQEGRPFCSLTKTKSSQEK